MQTPEPQLDSSSQDNSTPDLLEWGIAHDVPPLDQVDATRLRSALERGLTLASDELKSITARVDASGGEASPSEALEVVGQLELLGSTLQRALALYHNAAASASTPELRALRAEMEPRLAAHRADVYGDTRLYKLVKRALDESLNESGAATHTSPLTPVQRRLVARHLERFEDEGAHLSAEANARVAEINARLSALFTTFSDRVLADEEVALWLHEDELEGLSPAWVKSAALVAEELDAPDPSMRWAMRNTRSAVEPLLTSSPLRELRARVWRRFYERGALSEERSTAPIAREILNLRAERAELLGFETYAHQTLSRSMAQAPEAVEELLRAVWRGALDKFERELDAMRELARADGVEGELEPWDVRYYAEIVRRRDHAIDLNEVARYYELDALREGMFWAANECFGWRFAPADVPMIHPDMTAWEVRGVSDELIGRFYFDPFARSGKRSGAWMSAYRVQSYQGEERVAPLIINTCNFLKPSEGEPALLSLDDARTLFHEFGHAMHGLASDVKYASLAGTSVVRDFVEFPSQLNERWLNTEALRSRFCRHVDTGEPMPESLIAKLGAVGNAASGFATLEYLASALVDLKVHLKGAGADPAEVEASALSEWGLPKQVVMRHRPSHFAHIFSTDAYAASYYCYLWADVLVADAAELFQERGFYDRELTERYYDQILKRGHSVDSQRAFQALRGRGPTPEPLMRDRGFQTQTGA